jgi:hypothetical protein
MRNEHLHWFHPSQQAVSGSQCNQPLDIGIQHVLKQSMKQSAHKDIVNEMMAHLDLGKPPGVFKLDTMLGTLRDQCILWILGVYHDINTKELILKVSLFISLDAIRPNASSSLGFQNVSGG